MEKDDLDYLLPVNCPNPYYDTWDRHNSIAFSTATKGLRNAPGENNCFVNSAVQVFWHLDVFRRSYRRLQGHTCMGNSCIFCALKVIFTQFQFSDQSSLHPDALRKALAETFANQQRFQLGHMDDAAECFENILRRIHFHIANDCNEDSCTAPHCLPHQKFSLSIVEKVVCPCGASSDPHEFNEMVHYISAKALVSQARMMQETGDELHPDRFGLLLRNANALGDIRDCPGACGKKVQIRRALQNFPDVVSIGLVWDSDHPTVEMTTEVAKNIGTSVLMQDVFHSVTQPSLPKLQLVGLVCYYGKHYSTFVFHSKLQVWIYFDDATVREIGPRWEHVVDKCSKGRYQPLLLLYANPNASPVCVDTAPKKRTMAPGFGIPGGAEEESSLDRTHESISSQHSYQRSRTPNPESTHQQVDPNLHPRARSVTPSASDLSREEPASVFKSGDHSRQQSFIAAMNTKSDNKAKHPLRFGGQASSGSGQPGPMMPFSEQHDSMGHPTHSSQPSGQENENYSDYTLSTSNQYRRPSLGGFEPMKLPMTPNMKGYPEAQRKDSFKKGKESIRADVVRYQVDGARPQGAMSPTEYLHRQGQSYPYQGQGYDSSQAPAILAKPGTPSMFYQGNSQSHFRQRSLSQGGDEAYASDSSSYECPPQHTVVKPTTSSHNFDSVDGMSHSHTPTQSGLATLPRKKKDNSSLASHPRQNSGLAQDGNSFNRQGSIGNLNSIQDQRANPNLTGLPPPIPGKCPSTTVSDKMDSNFHKKQAEADKKSKKVRKELKKAEKKKSKIEASKSQPELSTTPKPSLHHSNSVASTCSNDSVRSPELSDEKVKYINSKMVEHVMKSQGLQRQPSTHSTNSQTSSSSIESDSLMARLLAAKDGSFDNISLGSHKDSGYGSSDRNSSSSTGSGTVDPYTQYFISKSMVVPRNLNPQFLQQPPHQIVSDFTAPNPQVYTANLGQPTGQAKDLSNASKEDMSRHLYETLTHRKVMHPIKESSQEDILKLLPKDQIQNSASVRESSPSSASDGLGREGRPPPIPPKNFAAFQVSKSAHQREPSIDSLDKNEVQNDYFLSMCEKADELMDRCILEETQDDLSAARRYCDSALDCLKEAMNQTDISNKALVYAQKKHNSCLLKSRSLFKKTGHGSSDGSSQGGKRSSITSTDSDNSDKPASRMTSKERLLTSNRKSTARLGHQTTQGNSQPQYQQQTQGHGHQDSTSSATRKSPMPQPQVNPQSGPRDAKVAGSQQYQASPQSYPRSSSSQNITSQAGYTQTSTGDQQAVPRPQSHISRSSATERIDSESVHSRSGSNSSIRSSASVPCSMSQAPNQPLNTVAKSQSAASNMSTALPHSSAHIPLDAYGTLPRNRKPRRTSDPTGNSEVYQMYLNRQKSIQGSSGSDSRESDSSSCEGNAQKKNYKAEIRELRDNSVVQRQMQQFSAISEIPKSGNVGITDPSQQAGEGRQQIGKRHSYDGPGQRGSYSSDNGSSGNVVSRGQAIQFSQASNVSQGSNVSLPSSHPQQIQQSVSVSGSQVASHAKSSPDSVQLLQQPQSARPVSQPNFNSKRPPHPNPQHIINADPSSRYQPSNNISGYNQPLPGNRTLAAPSQQSSRTNTQARSSSCHSNPSQTYVQSYPQQNIQGQGVHQSRNLSQTPVNDNQFRPNYPQTDSSYNTNQQMSQLPRNNNLPNRTAQQNSVQNLGQNVQNLSLNRRNSGGPPPPPPARTTSNPEFRHQSSQPQQQQQQFQKGHPSYHNQQQHPGQNFEVASRSQQRSANVARVPPNSHLDYAQSAGNGQQRGSNSDFTGRPLPTQVCGLDLSQIQAPQLKHATSSTALNYLPMTPRPLERYASQPDCQNLVDPASFSNQTDFLPPSFAPSNPLSSNTNAKAEPRLENGQQRTLPQTFDNLSTQGQNVQDSATQQHPVSDDPSQPLPNVKALASRFDRSSDKPAIKPKPNISGGSRTRSKSESGSKKPKSVLKNKKSKSSKMPRKSVTFAENLSKYATGYESAAELTSFSSSSRMNDRAYFSDDEDHITSKPVAYSDNEIDDVEDSSNSDDGPLPREELACQLCRKREIEVGKGYCSKCSFYMSRLVSS